MVVQGVGHGPDGGIGLSCLASASGERFEIWEADNHFSLGCNFRTLGTAIDELKGTGSYSIPIARCPFNGLPSPGLWSAQKAEPEVEHRPGSPALLKMCLYLLLGPKLVCRSMGITRIPLREEQVGVFPLKASLFC